MSTATIASTALREPVLLGQTVVVIGGSSGIGLETAHRARAEGAKVILTARNPERLRQAASQVEAQSTAAFDATDPVAIERFFHDLPVVDHVMVTAGRPYYGRLAEMDFAKVRDLVGQHLLQALSVARNAISKVRPEGTIIFMGGTGARRPAIGLSIASAMTAALPALTASIWLRLDFIPPGDADHVFCVRTLAGRADLERAVRCGGAAVVLVLLGGTTWLSGGLWAPDGVYSRFASPAIGVGWNMLVSEVLLCRSPATRAAW
jgi:NAD(P)-dependent dehydrogenase (short-subunit alcohol dehydrogenase family)